MFVFAAYLDGFYKLFLVLHIFCAIVGFGAVYLNALYGRQIQKHKGREGLAIYEANFHVSAVGQYFIYGVFVFGLLLVLTSDDVWKEIWIEPLPICPPAEAEAFTFARPGSAEQSAVTAAPPCVVTETMASPFCEKVPKSVETATPVPSATFTPFSVTMA